MCCTRTRHNVPGLGSAATPRTTWCLQPAGLAKRRGMGHTPCCPDRTLTRACLCRRCGAIAAVPLACAAQPACGHAASPSACTSLRAGGGRGRAGAQQAPGQGRAASWTCALVIGSVNRGALAGTIDRQTEPGPCAFMLMHPMSSTLCPPPCLVHPCSLSPAALPFPTAGRRAPQVRMVKECMVPSADCQVSHSPAKTSGSPVDR